MLYKNKATHLKRGNSTETVYSGGSGDSNRSGDSRFCTDGVLAKRTSAQGQVDSSKKLEEVHVETSFDRNFIMIGFVLLSVVVVMFISMSQTQSLVQNELKICKQELVSAQSARGPVYGPSYAAEICPACKWSDLALGSVVGALKRSATAGIYTEVTTSVEKTITKTFQPGARV